MKETMDTNGRRNAGFTLIELMIVVAILAILGLLAAPALYTYAPDYRVNNAAKALATEMQLTRMRAISKNVRHLVTFDATNQRIVIDEVDATGTPTDSEVFKTINFYKAGRTDMDHTNVSLGRLATGTNPYRAGPGMGNPNGNLDTPTTIGSGSDTTLTFLPNGLTTASGEFYIIASADLTSTDPDRLPHIRAVQVLRAGMTRKFKWDLSVDPVTNLAGWEWEEF